MIILLLTEAQDRGMSASGIYISVFVSYLLSALKVTLWFGVNIIAPL